MTKQPRRPNLGSVSVVGVGEAKTHLSRLLREVAAGEEVVIERDGTPVARLVAIHPPKREFGFDRGKIWIADDFDDPLPPEIQQYFE